MTTTHAHEHREIDAAHYPSGDGKVTVADRNNPKAWIQADNAADPTDRV